MPSILAPPVLKTVHKKIGIHQADVVGKENV